jgi:hypothetical protein
MGRILAAKEPLSVSTLDGLQCNDDPEGLIWIIKYMGAVLSGIKEHDVPVRPLHTSFHDFLVNPECSKQF